jgi:hypothetical protein
MEFVKLDVKDLDATSETIREIKPDLIVNTMMEPALPSILMLPEKTRKTVTNAGFSWWLPLHFTLIYKLMKAIKKSGVSTCVVNYAYPDCVNPVLAKAGLAVATGAGNVQTFAAAARLIVSEKLNVPIREVEIYALQHHYVGAHYLVFGEFGNVPLYMKIFMRDKDVTDKFNLKKLLSEAIETSFRGDKIWAFPNTGRIFQFASTLVKVTTSILSDTKEIINVPGPIGLPGGWPVRMGVTPEVALPDGLDMKDAIGIMEEQQKAEGIERIENDGTVVFTDEMVTTMRGTFNYDHEKMRPEESEEMSKELVNAINQQISK